MGKGKAQAAFEYLVIVSIVLVFMIPIWAYVTTTQRDTSTELTLTYAKNTANQIADASNLVYSQGPPAKVKINVYVPHGVNNITILNNSIRFEVMVDSKITDIFAFSTAQMNGTLSKKKGYYWIEVEAMDDTVQIKQSSS
ncbi:MAG: hypothetical protein JSW41_04105 [Candidatus Aenigmatarchaeota archaeon]|nr:MAG: hypothetical protein JSW41_04105 [Candidatus Aenigmarchaeota archaeon]